MISTSQSGGRAAGRARTSLITLVLVGSTFLTGVDLFIVNVAFDKIGRDFASHGDTTSLAHLSWILNAYAVVFAALLVPLGRLTDRYGRKTGFVVGLAVFTAASGACGLSTSVWMLVAFRALQAVGAAAMTPASLGLLLAALPPERRAPAARLWALTGAVAASLGPALGGGLVQISWQWAFWVNLPLGVVLVVAALRFVPDVRHNDGAPRPDLTGALVLAVAVGLVVLGTVQGNDWGWGSGRVLGSYAGALVALALFAGRTLRHPAPVVDPALLRVPSFTWAGVTALFFNAAFGASLLAGILWMQQAWDYSALRTGFAIALGPMMVPITSIVAHRLFPRGRPGAFVLAGCVVFALGSVVMALSLQTTPAYWTTMLPAWLIRGVGVGLAMPNLIAAATAKLPAEQASTGGGVINMARQVGLVVGVSVLVAMVGQGLPVVATYRHANLVVALVALVGAGCAGLMEGRRTRVAVPELLDALDVETT